MDGWKNKESYFLLDENSVKDFVRERIDFFEADADLSAEEIGDGNINYVFRVRDKKTGSSVVVKQADRLLRSSGRPLDQNRIKIEAEILKLQGERMSELVPSVYAFDETMHAILMEDISNYKNMRKELMAGKVFPHFPELITDYFSEAVFSTADLFMNRKEKKRQVSKFINPDLCDITEDLVLTEPYDDYKGRNRITNEMEDFVRTHLYEDEELKAEVGVLRNLFMNKAEALIHGDLHTGSVFINENGIKIIDPEFAFYGPIAYDVGNVIANLFFSWNYHLFFREKTDPEFTTWISSCIEKVIALFQGKIMEKLRKEAASSLYNERFGELFVGELLAESIGFTGTELIRRTVGDAKVIELTTITDNSIRIKAERFLLEAGILFIKKRKELKNGKEVTDMFKKVVNRG